MTLFKVGSRVLIVEKDSQRAELYKQNIMNQGAEGTNIHIVTSSEAAKARLRADVGISHVCLAGERLLRHEALAKLNRPQKKSA